MTSKPNNEYEWRRRLRQKKDSVDTLSYSHWVDFTRGASDGTKNQGGFHCNFHVTTTGAPRAHQNEKSGPCLLRQITISPTVTIRNLLACEIEVNLGLGIDAQREGESVAGRGTRAIRLRPGEVRFDLHTPLPSFPSVYFKNSLTMDFTPSCYAGSSSHVDSRRGRT